MSGTAIQSSDHDGDDDVDIAGNNDGGGLGDLKNKRGESKANGGNESAKN